MAGVPACEADAGFRLAGSCLKGLKKAGFIPGCCDVKCIHYRTQEQGIVDRRNAPGGDCFPNPERLWSGWLRIRENAGLQVRELHGIGKKWRGACDGWSSGWRTGSRLSFAYPGNAGGSHPVRMAG